METLRRIDSAQEFFTKYRHRNKLNYVLEFLTNQEKFNYLTKINKNTLRVTLQDDSFKLLFSF